MPSFLDAIGGWDSSPDPITGQPKPTYPQGMGAYPYTGSIIDSVMGSGTMK